MKLYNIHIMNWKKISMRRKWLWNMGRCKALKFKNQEKNVIDSFVCALWQPIDFLDNIPKYSYIISQFFLCSAKWICFYSQVFQIWLLIQRVFGSVVGRSVGKWSAFSWSLSWLSVDLIKSKKKNMFRGVISTFYFAIWSRFILLF